MKTNTFIIDHIMDPNFSSKQDPRLQGRAPGFSFHYFSYTPVYVRQVRLSGTPVYICLHQTETSQIRQKQVNKRQGKDRDKIREEEGKKVGRGGCIGEVREW